jgi:DNA-binding transcriptional ArsR family regulator
MILMPHITEHRLDQIKAVASDVRLNILDWLKEPGRNFPDQVTDDPEKIGVCVTLIAKKAGISQPTASRHLEILKRNGLVTVQRINSWSFFKRDEAGLADFYQWLSILCPTEVGDGFPNGQHEHVITLSNG